MAAEAVPVEEMAIHTEAFQDVEVFPTEFTQILCPSLHRTPGHRVSWTQSHPPRPSVPLQPCPPLEACADRALDLTSWFSDGGAGGTLGSETGGSSVLGVSAST